MPTAFDGFVYGASPSLSLDMTCATKEYANYLSLKRRNDELVKPREFPDWPTWRDRHLAGKVSTDTPRTKNLKARQPMRDMGLGPLSSRDAKRYEATRR